MKVRSSDVRLLGRWIWLPLDGQLCRAKAIAHLDQHLEQMPAAFTYEERCVDADLWAGIRLDREEWRAEL
jgi:hypothetical protein